MIKNKKYFTNRLLLWDSEDNFRQMPWKNETDPYKIWISEIILQQTRVDQGWAYYEKFIKNFSTINKLASAADQKVFKLWEGLGYYSRCKNMLETARYIVKEKQGEFPKTYQQILLLKGIGPYTAAAIASFAYNQPYAVVDGNVFRVLSRFFAINTPTDSTVGKKEFSILANQLLDKNKPAVYNQAIMDFGAVICKPQQPLCITCPLKNKCAALKNGQVNMLPVKEKKIEKKIRWFYYFIVEFGSKIYVSKRVAKDIWANLYEFILLESKKEISTVKLINNKNIGSILGPVIQENIYVSKIYKQSLTHQTIKGRFIKLVIKKPLMLKDYKLVNIKALKKLPFPKFIKNHLAENKL